jgi:ribonuclease E
VHVVAEPHATTEPEPSGLSITEPVQPAVSASMPTMESASAAEILTPPSFEPTQPTGTEAVTAYVPPAEAAAGAEHVEERQDVVETQTVLATLRLDSPSDLVQIETDPQKVRPRAVEEEEAPRPRRVRRPPPPISDEPLIQVETRRGDTGAEAASLQQV